MPSYEREQHDPLLLEYLAIPTDDDGFVIPKHRARAAQLSKIMRARDRCEVPPVFPMPAKKSDPIGWEAKREIRIANRKRRYAPPPHHTPPPPPEHVQMQIIHHQKKDRPMTALEKIVDLVSERKEVSRRLEEIDQEISSITDGDGIDLGAGLFIGKREAKRTKPTLVESEKTTTIAGNKPGVTNSILDVIGELTLTREEIWERLDGYKPQQVSLALTLAVQRGTLKHVKTADGQLAWRAA